MVVHSAAQYELFSGRTVPGFPSMGSWVLYGLGSENDSLPSYVVMPDPRGALEAGQPMYAHGFLPAVYQPTMFRPGDRPVLNLELPGSVGASQRGRTLRLIRELNEATLDPTDEEFAARIQRVRPGLPDAERGVGSRVHVSGFDRRPFEHAQTRCPGIGS